MLDFPTSASSATRTCFDDNDNDAEGEFSGQAPHCVCKYMHYYSSFYTNIVHTIFYTYILSCTSNCLYFNDIHTYTVQKCVNLPTIAGGVIAYSQDQVDMMRPDSTVAIYVCTDEGLTLTGNNMRTCESGEWTGSDPTCARTTNGKPAYA